MAKNWRKVYKFLIYLLQRYSIKYVSIKTSLIKRNDIHVISPYSDKKSKLGLVLDIISMILILLVK